MDIISWIIIGLIVVLLFIATLAESDYQKRKRKYKRKPHQGKQECKRRRLK